MHINFNNRPHRVLRAIVLLVFVLSTFGLSPISPASAQQLESVDHQHNPNIDPTGVFPPWISNQENLSTSVTNEMIAEEAEGRVGQVGGQCKVFVQNVLAALGITLGTGYRQAYLDKGIEISADNADRGDIIQLNNPNDPENGTDYTLHTAIITKRLEGGNFEVVDSNWGLDGIVKRRVYNPTSDASARGLVAHFYRLGSQPASSPPLPNPPRVSVKYFQITWPGFYVFDTCHTGRIKVYLDDQLQLYTSSLDGSNPSKSITKLLWPKFSWTKPYVRPYEVKIEYWDYQDGHIPEVSRDVYFPGGGYLCADEPVQSFPPPSPNDGQPPSPPNTDLSTFVSDVTLLDGSVVLPSQSLTKTWRVKNTGTSTWGTGYQLVFVGSDQMGAPNAIDVPSTAPGQTADISVNLTAPSTNGTHTGYWQLRNPQGVYFGPKLSVSIVVNAGGVTGSTVPTADGIQLLSTNYPTVVTPGQSFLPSVTIKLLNGELYGVDSRGDMLRYKSGGMYGAFEHVAVGTTVHTGEQYTFNFTQDMVAPTELGTYDSVWQVWAAGGWVGPEVHITFQVQNDPNRAPNVPSPQSPDNWYVSRTGSMPTLCAQPNGDPDGDPIAGYDFQIYDSAQNWDSGWVTSNCATPSGLGYYGYTWHVRAMDNKGAISDWSDSWHFNIDSGDVTVTDIHFDIASPSSSESVRVYASTSGCGGTNIGLRVLINTASDGSTNGQWNIIYELGVPTLTDANAPYWDTRPYEDGTHLVRVLAKGCTDATWEDGSFKDVPYTLLHRKPSWPPPQTPVNNSWLNSRTVEFRWDAALRAQSYHLWVSLNPNPETSPLVDQTFGADVLSYSFTFDQPYSAVYWKIRATNELGYNESVVYKFGIDQTPPTTSIETLPATTYQTSFVIHWSGSDDSSGLLWYDVQVRDTLQTQWQDLREKTTDTAMIFTGLPGHVYCFQTRGLDAAGNWEAYPGGNGDQCVTIDLTTKPAQNWWDTNYQFERDLVILNNDGNTLPVDYPIRLSFDQSTNPTAGQIYNASVSPNKGDDVRIIYNGVEIPRFIRTFTSSQVEIWFDAQSAISAGGSDNTHYQMYYGNSSAALPGFSANNIFYPKADSSTVGLWHFQEGSGTTVADNSGNGHTGSAIGNPQWMLGPYGYFLNFNRLSPYYGDYVNVGSINLNNFTLEAWINLYNLDAGGDIISKWGGSGNNSYNFAIWNARLGIQLSGPGGNRELQSQSVQPAIGKWQHVAATYDNSYIRLYINGNLVAEKADSGGIYSTSTPTVIGRSNDGSNGTWYFQGGISNAAVSNVAKTSFPYATLPTIATAPSVQVSAEITYQPPITGKADLIIDSVNVTPLPLEQGGGNLVDVTITNQGDASTQNGFFTDLYLDHIPTGAGDHAGSIQLWVADSIAPGETVSLTTQLNQLSANLQSKTVNSSTDSTITENSGTLYAQTDSTGIVAETDKTNNIDSSGVNLCFASDDSYESDNISSNATLINVGQTQDHNFAHPGDEDWIKFSAQAGQTYTVSTGNLGASADTYLYLYDTDGQTLLASNDDHSNSLASQIQWTAPQSDTYYALIKDWNPNVGGCETQYQVSVTTTGSIASTFTDVSNSYWAYSWIERLYNAGITGGCSVTPLNYCPDNNVTRDQMAVFLERGMHGSSFNPPTVLIIFADTSGNFAQYWIEALKSDGITSGCGTDLYCPTSPTTRAQMAVFLLKSEHGADYTPPPATGSKFTDVPASYWASSWIEQLANEGITSGCATNLYCPDQSVTRAQMAVFLVKTFGLP